MIKKFISELEAFYIVIFIAMTIGMVWTCIEYPSRWWLWILLWFVLIASGMAVSWHYWKVDLEARYQRDLKKYQALKKDADYYKAKEFVSWYRKTVLKMHI